MRQDEWGAVSSFFPFNRERLPGGGKIRAVWSRPSPLPGLSPALTLTWPLHWQSLWPGSGQMHRWWPPFPHDPRATRHQLVVPGVLRTKGLPDNRTGASVLLIGLEASSERRPRRNPGPQRSAHHPHCFWQRRCFGKHRHCGGRPCSPAPPHPGLLLAGPETRKAGLSPAGSWTGHRIGCNHRLETSAAGPSMLKPRGQGRGLCPWPGMQGGTLGDSPPSPAQVWVGRSPAPPTVLRCLGPSRVWVSRARGRWDEGDSVWRRDLEP